MPRLMSAGDGKTTLISSFTTSAPSPSDGEDERQQDGGELRLMESGVTGHIDHCDFLVLLVCAHLLPDLSHRGGAGQTGPETHRQTDRQANTTPWPLGSPGLR